jgi:hypothetical protein
MTAVQQALWVEVGCSIQLSDSSGQHVSMFLLFIGVFQEFLGDGLGMNARRSVVMTLVSQDANNFGCERFIHQPDDGFRVGLITLGNSSFFDVLPGASSNLLYVGDEISGLLLASSFFHVSSISNNRRNPTTGELTMRGIHFGIGRTL